MDPSSQLVHRYLYYIGEARYAAGSESVPHLEIDAVIVCLAFCVFQIKNDPFHLSFDDVLDARPIGGI
jgi:hypothetical protein